MDEFKKINIDEVRYDMQAIKYFSDKYAVGEVQINTLKSVINVFAEKYDNISEIDGQGISSSEISRDIFHLAMTINHMENMCKKGTTYENILPNFLYAKTLINNIQGRFPEYVDNSPPLNWDNADGYVEFE